MTQKLTQETLTLTRKGRAEAAEEHFPTESFPWVVSGQIEKNLEHIEMLMTGINEDALYLEKRMSDNKSPDEYGRDAESGKKVGKIWPVTEDMN